MKMTTENTNEVPNIISPGSNKECRDDNNDPVLSKISVQPERVSEEPLYPTETTNKVANISPGSSNVWRDDENNGVLSQIAVHQERVSDENMPHQEADEESSRYALDFMK